MALKNLHNQLDRPDQFPGLEYEDAAALISLSAIATLAASSGAGTIKQIFKKFDFKDMKKFDLHHHEGGAHGGHTLRDHIWETDKKLLDSFEHKVKSDPNNAKAASSAFYKESSSFAVNSCISKRKVDIQKWNNDPSTKPVQAFDVEVGKAIGRGIAKGDSGVSDWTKVRVVLEKNPNGGEPLIKTSYPINKIEN